MEYHYVIKAENSSGKSRNSIEVAATPQGEAATSTAGWSNGKQFGTASDDQALDIASDTAGNIYVAGLTLGSLDGNAYAGGDGDAFVMKYSSAGVKEWTREFGTAGFDQANGITVDANGNVYIVGQTWGGLNGNTYTGGDGDAFVVKYDNAGTQQWTKQIGTIGGDSANAVAIDVNGNVYIAGAVGGGLGGKTYAGGDADAFIAKYDTLGEQQWLQQFGADGADEIAGITVDASGNVLVAGVASGSFLDGTFVGGIDAFVAKFDALGTPLWADIFGATVGVFGQSHSDAARGVAVDPAGNVYVGGWTGGALDGNTSNAIGGGFVAKYDAKGARQWLHQIMGFEVVTNDLAVDTLGNVYAAGQTRMGLGGNRNVGAIDPFIIKFDAAGVKQWTRQPGTSLDDYSFGVTVTSTGDAFVAGATEYELNGNKNAGNFSLDGFILRYDSGGGG